MVEANTLAIPAVACVVDGDAGAIEVNLEKIDRWVDTAPDREVARFVANGLPVLSKIVDRVKARVLARMQERKQKAMPVGDGRMVQRQAKPNYSLPVEAMQEIKALFQAAGLGSEPEVEQLVQESHSLELTENICKALGFTLAKAKETGAVKTRTILANGTDMKKVLPFGGEGAERLQALIDQAKKDAPETLRLGGKLKPTADAAGRIQDAQGGLSEAAATKEAPNPFKANE